MHAIPLSLTARTLQVELRAAFVAAGGGVLEHAPMRVLLG